MREIEKVIDEVDSSMSMEGMPLTNEDKDRLRICLANPSEINNIIGDLIKKHTVAQVK